MHKDVENVVLNRLQEDIYSMRVQNKAECHLVQSQLQMYVFGDSGFFTALRMSASDHKGTASNDLGVTNKF